MKDEIKDSNLLIAKFMGDLQYVWKTHYSDLMEVEAELLNLEETFFHNSWNWIMPVVEKIESMECVHFFSMMKTYAGINVQNASGDRHLIESCKTVTESMNLPHRPEATKTYTKQMNSKLEAVYYCVVEFIKWYNLK